METLKELSDRFNVTIQSMLEYVKKHQEEINIDGEHARKANGKWIFDEVAVKRIEDLKGFGVAGVIESLESDKVRELKILVDNLQTALLTAQNEALQATKQLADGERERRLLAEARITEAEELAALREKNRAQAEKIRELESSMERIMDANVLERIFRKW